MDYRSKRVAASLAAALLFCGSLVAAQQAQRPGQPARDTAQTRPAPLGTASISGTVSVAGSGQPARKVRVNLSGEELRGSRSTSTDDQGRFSFTALPAGRFNLSVAKPGHVTVSYGQRRPGTPGTPIQLADGQQFEARLQIPRGSVLTGVVLDEHGEATPGTQVRAMRYALQNGRRTLQSAGAGTTDDRGIYRIYGLQPGEYVVCATPRNTAVVNAIGQLPPGFGQNIGPLLENLGAAGADARAVQERLAAVQAAAAQQAEQSMGYAPVCYPGTTSVAQAGSVALAIGEERPGVDFQLQLVPLARVEGTVISATGAPVQNVQVSLVDAQGRTPIGVTSTARVDANGNFRLNGVAPGQYRLQARMQAGGGRGAVQGAILQGMLGGGRGGRGGQMAAQQRPEPEIYWAAMDLNVDGRLVSNVALTLQPGLKLSGEVTFDGLATPPADLTRMRVSVTSVDGGPMAGSRAATVDATGRFTVSGLAPGMYRVNATGVAGWSVESANVGGIDALDFPFELKPGGGIGGITITMTDRQSELAGFVVDGSYQPAVEYTIVIFPADQRYWGSSTRRVRTVRPATDGRYMISNLPPGDYRIAPVLDLEPGATADPSFLQQLESGSIRVTLQPGEKKVQDVRVSR